MYDEEAEDLMNFFRGAVGRSGNNKYTPADELDDIWKEYIDYVEELKADGYKVMRSEKGKHKVIKTE